MDVVLDSEATISQCHNAPQNHSARNSFPYILFHAFLHPNLNYTDYDVD